MNQAGHKSNLKQKKSDLKGQMLIGQYEARFGAKNRIAFPKKLREVLGDDLIITFGYEKSLIIVSQDQWKQLLEGTEGRPFIQKESRETQRFLLGGASRVELDHKGRFVVPSYLRDFGKIQDEVVFLGLYKYVEMWDKKIWDSYRGKLEQNIDRISQKLIESDKKDSGEVRGGNE